MAAPMRCWIEPSNVNFGCIFFFCCFLCTFVLLFIVLPIHDNPANQFHVAFLLSQQAKRRRGSAGEHEATHVKSRLPVAVHFSACLTSDRPSAQLWQLICGDVDSHDLTRLVRLFAERHLRALTRLNLHLNPTPIRRNRQKLGPFKR